MNKHLVALVLFALCSCHALTSFSQDPSDNQVLEELLQKNAETVAKWREGFIDAKVEWHERSADVTAFWEGDRSRRIRKDVGRDGSLTVREIVHNPNRYCEFSDASLVAKCDTVGVPHIPQLSRVLPTEIWNHINFGMSVPTWLRHEFPKAKLVVRSSDGFEVYLGKSEHISEVVSTMANGSLTLELPEGEYVVRTHFNRHGLLVSNHYYGTLPTHSLLIENVWTDDPVPLPKVLSTRSRKLPGTDYAVLYRITAENVGVGLPKNAPSLAIPPVDVPFGWKIVNNLGGEPVETYVGGEEGKAHWDRNRFAKRLVAEFHAD